MKIMYLTIVGIKIKLIFHYPNIENINKIALNDLEFKIRQKFSGFINSRNSDYDYEIHFLNKEPSIFIKRHHNNDLYFMYFYQRNSRKINSFLGISLNQFMIIIMDIIKHTLIRNNGFIFHASSCVSDGEITIFLGKSKSGKSTIVKLLNDRFPTFTDDTIVILRENHNFICYQLPLIEKNYLIPRNKEGFPLNKIFFIHKSTRWKKEKILNKQKIFLLLVKQLWTEDKEKNIYIKRLINFLEEFTEFYYLWFTKECIDFDFNKHN